MTAALVANTFAVDDVSVSQNPDTGAIRPRVGWAVRPAPQAS
jgi:hypothetical protein